MRAIFHQYVTIARHGLGRGGRLLLVCGRVCLLLRSFARLREAFEQHGRTAGGTELVGTASDTEHFSEGRH